MTTFEPEDGRPKRPFQTTADPDVFFENALYAETFSRLLSAVEGGEPLAVLTGQPGTGKTTILRRLMGELEGSGLRFIVCSVPLGLDDLRARLPAAEPERRVALGLDEAQALADELLTALPALLAGRPDVRILLVGQPKLEEKLAALEARGVTLPASVRCRVAPLAAREVGPYIEYRWRKASGEPNPFPPSAVPRIASVSEGIPQMVNLICSQALHLAETRGQDLVSAEMVDEVVRDLKLGAPEPSAHRMRPRTRRIKHMDRAVIAAVVAIPLLIVGVDLFLRPATRGREQPVETPPAPRVERPSIEPPAVAARSPDPAWSEPATAAQPAPKRERESQTARPMVSVVPAPPPRAPTVRTPVPITRSEPAKDEALLQRSEDGDVQAARTLLAEGASPDARDPAGFTPLMLTVVHDHPTLVELLIARGASVNSQNRAGLTPLMLAAINNHSAVLRTLIDRGADMNARTKAGWTALTYAAWRGHPDIVRLLLARGADPNVTDREGWTILQYASWRAQPASSDDLSDMLTGADALRMTAAGPGHTEVIALLRQAGVKR